MGAAQKQAPIVGLLLPRPWVASSWAAAVLHVSICALSGRPELAVSAGLSWAVFLVAVADQPEPVAAPADWQRAVGLVLCLASGLAFAAFGSSDANDRGWRDGQSGVLSAARATPLLFGLGLLLWRAPFRELHRRALPLCALACPLFTPVPGWVRLHFSPSLLSAWGAEQALRLAHQPIDRRGLLLVLPGSALLVDSECSGLGAVMQLLAVVVLLAVVTRAPARRIAPLVPIAIAVALLVNFVRVALLAWFLERGERGRFGYWHAGQGALLYSALTSLLLLAVGLPLTVGRSRASGSS